MKKDLLTINDFSSEDVLALFEKSTDLKEKRENGIEHLPLKGKSLGMIFNKHSTRTRISSRLKSLMVKRSFFIKVFRNYILLFVNRSRLSDKTGIRLLISFREMFKGGRKRKTFCLIQLIRNPFFIQSNTTWAPGLSSSIANIIPLPRISLIIECWCANFCRHL